MIPAEGWSNEDTERPRWTSHNPFARPPKREGFTPWFIGRHGAYVTFTYRPIEKPKS